MSQMIPPSMTSPQVGDTVQITGTVEYRHDDETLRVRVGNKYIVVLEPAFLTVIARTERPLQLGDDVILSNGLWTIAAVDGHEAWVRLGVGSRIVPLSELRRA